MKLRARPPAPNAHALSLLISQTGALVATKDATCGNPPMRSPLRPATEGTRPPHSWLVLLTASPSLKRMSFGRATLGLGIAAIQIDVSLGGHNQLGCCPNSHHWLAAALASQMAQP